MSELNDEVCRKLIAAINSNPAGVTNEDIAKLTDVTVEQRVAGLNKLTQEGLLEILQKGDKLVFRSKDPKKNILLKGADNEEKIVYSIVEEGGSKGIWIRDIRLKSNLNMTQLNKILKNLENKKFIKAVKSVNASKKKVYMLYNLEPDRSITGGAWYQDQDFEAEFVDVLNQQCLRFLQQKKDATKDIRDSPLVLKQMASCTVTDVHKFISELGISKVKLDEDDLETILKTVVYDGKAERTLLIDGTYLYRAIDNPLPSPGLVQTPCGICPIIKNCSDVGEITPKLCEYMCDWLNGSK